MKRPFVLIGSSIFISAILYSYCNLIVAVTVFGICTLAIIPLFIFRNKHDAVKSLLICACSLLAISLSYSIKTVYDYAPAVILCNHDDNTISGELVEYDNSYGNHYYILKNITVNGNETNQKIKISSPYYYNIKVDDIVTFTTSGIYDLSNSKSALNKKADGVYITAYAEKRIEQISPEKRSMNYHLTYIRDFISKKLKNNLHKNFASAVDAMITGNKQHLSQQVQINFSYSGISHLFAVSGFHLTVWTSLIYFALQKLTKNKKQWLCKIACIVFVVFFMAMTGFSQSVVRAGIMQIILFASYFSKYKADSLNSLFIALSVILFINPFAAMSISLQLSFLATLGIISFSSVMNEQTIKISQKNRSKRYTKIITSIYSTAIISVVTTIFTCFTSATTFGHYSIAAPLTNLLCIFPAQLIMPSGILLIIFEKIPIIGKLFVTLCNLVMRYIFDITDAIASSSLSTVKTDTPFRLAVFAVMTLIILVLLPVFYENNKRVKQIVAVSTAYVFLFSSIFIVSDKNSHKITVADVGNGTTVVYTLGDKNIMIGCGGNKYKDYVTTNMLKQLNANSIDLLIIPRSNDTEQLYTTVVLKAAAFDEIIMADEEFHPKTKIAIKNKEIRTTNEQQIQIDKNTVLHYINNTSFTGVRIASKNFNCTIIFRPTSDFNTVSEEWLSGDLLITRQSLPETDLSGFKNIFVSNDFEEPFDNTNIYSTGVNGNLSYKSNPFGGVNINVDYR